MPGTTTGMNSAYRSVTYGGSLGATWFPLRALRTSLGAAFSGTPSWTDSTRQTTRAATSLNAGWFVGAGVRGDRWELALTYTFRAAWQDGALAPIEWGTLELDARGLIGSRVWLTGSLSNLQRDGVRLGGSIEGFVTPRLGLFGHLYVSAGNVSGQPERYTAVDLLLGVGWWITGRIELSPSLYFLDRIGSDLPLRQGPSYHRELQYLGGTLELRFRLR